MCVSKNGVRLVQAADFLGYSSLDYYGIKRVTLTELIAILVTTQLLVSEVSFQTLSLPISTSV
jgi:hypothetical protein